MGGVEALDVPSDPVCATDLCAHRAVHDARSRPWRSFDLLDHALERPLLGSRGRSDTMQPGIMTRARRQPLRAILIALGLLLAIGLLGRWVIGRQDEGRALRTLPEPERRALYERTLENLRTVCAREGTGDLRDFCADQAKVARELPECGAECRQLTGPYLPGATR
jgi:hypothetical protein